MEQYLAAVGLPKGHAWCAAFIKWTCNRCGVKTSGNAYVPSWFNSKTVIWQRGKAIRAVPERGDVGSIYNHRLQREAHMFFVDDWPERGDVKTVEGNTNLFGVRDGQGVAVLYRSKSVIHRVARLL